jgi:1-deoxy-D-xylulose-5-phosphate reductoisomerase
MKKVSIWGSTGSIGVQTLDVIEQHPHLFKVVSLAAGQSSDRLVEQVLRFQPQFVSVKDQVEAERLKSLLPSKVQVFWGAEGLIRLINQETDIAVNALVGRIGLEPTLEAIKNGVPVALANKETLVTAGHLVMAAARKAGLPIIPIDSEHSAVFQCLNGESPADLHQIILTASGGPFRDYAPDQLSSVTVAQALNHPNWSMGAKITIDSATMMNKGFEVIEAHWLFNLDYSHINVMIHRESIIHSMVEFKDKTIMAQLAAPDMRIPIQYALLGPGRLPLKAASLDLLKIGSLHFSAVDWEKYRCLKLAYQAGEKGGSFPTVLNAANEVAVARFLTGDIRFLDIAAINQHVLDKHEGIANPSYDEIVAADNWARGIASQIETG